MREKGRVLGEEGENEFGRKEECKDIS